MIQNTLYMILATVAQFSLGSGTDLGFPKVAADQGTLQNIFNTIFILIGALSTGFVIWGGIRYVVSSGNPEQTRRAREIVLYALIGLIVSMLAVGIVSFVAGQFGTSSGGGGGGD